jgi:hypothetical protein
LSLWAVGRYDLGLSEDDFWDLWFNEYDELCKQHLAHEEAEDFRSAQIACLFANAFRDQKKRRSPFTIDDFMPSRAAEPKRNQTPEEMLTVVMAINAALGGKVIENG